MPDASPSLEAWILYIASSWGDDVSDLDAVPDVLGDNQGAFLDCLRRSLGIAESRRPAMEGAATFGALANVVAGLWDPTAIEASWQEALEECVADAGQSSLADPVGALIVETPFPAEWDWDDWTVVMQLHTYERSEQFEQKLVDAIQIYQTAALSSLEWTVPGLLIDEAAFRRVVEPLLALLDHHEVPRRQKVYAALGVHDGGFDHRLELEG